MPISMLTAGKQSMTAHGCLDSSAIERCYHGVPERPWVPDDLLCHVNSLVLGPAMHLLEVSASMSCTKVSLYFDNRALLTEGNERGVG